MLVEVLVVVVVVTDILNYNIVSSHQSSVGEEEAGGARPALQRCGGD